jgi:hypothetical protein
MVMVLQAKSNGENKHQKLPAGGGETWAHQPRDEEAHVVNRAGGVQDEPCQHKHQDGHMQTARKHLAAFSGGLHTCGITYHLRVEPARFVVPVVSHRFARGKKMAVLQKHPIG